MSRDFVDVLMITFNRAEYTRRSLGRLLDTCDESCRVWIWQNGSDPETLDVVSDLRSHPRVFKFFHSKENRKLRDPTNWLLSNSDGHYLSKVDDDCLVPFDWIDKIRQAHQDVPALGVIGCWHFAEEDFDFEAAEHKIRSFGNHHVVSHPWIGGSGFLAKRACIDKVGLLKPSESGITGLFLRIALAGWTNGWHYPLLLQDHMDDPRSANTMIKSDADLQRHLPLSAANFGSDSLAKWDAQLRRSAAALQSMRSDARYYSPWRKRARKVMVSLGLRAADGPRWVRTRGS